MFALCCAEGSRGAVQVRRVGKVNPVRRMVDDDDERVRVVLVGWGRARTLAGPRAWRGWG